MKTDNLFYHIFLNYPQQLPELKIQQDFIDLIETIIVYKLPQKTREEIEAMLGLHSIKETKVYQEAFDEGIQLGKQEGKQEGEQIGEKRAKISLIPTLINEGFTVAKVAQILDLSVDFVQKVIKDNNS
jgi:predicted transposase/invertase (TIGR01784 family)